MIDTSTLKLIRLEASFITAEEARGIAAAAADIAAEQLINCETVRRAKEKGGHHAIKAMTEKAQRMEAICNELLEAAKADDPLPCYREEPTAAGLQLVIPGCERRPPDNGKPAQLSLFP